MSASTVTSREDLHLRLHRVRTRDGKEWFAAFTSHAEQEKGEQTSVLSQCIGDFLAGCRNMTPAGIAVNPWGKPFMLTKELIGLLLDADRTEKGENT